MSPEPGPGSSADGDATAELWRRRSPHSPAVAAASALLGVDSTELAAATALSVAASDEATILLDSMELRIRTLTTTVATSAERCVSAVRGPIMWAETITARANALGNDDVFVCMTTTRSFDTVENQVLVDALDSIAAAGAALRTPAGDRLDADERQRVGDVAAEAAAWRADDRLKGIRVKRLTGRAATRIRKGHRSGGMGPVLAVRRRAREPFEPDDVVALADEPTRALHRSVLRVLDAYDAHRLLTLSEGGLWCRTLSFRHPATPGLGPTGLAIRGRAILPPAGEVDGAPWADALPADGIRLTPGDGLPAELEELLGQSRSSTTSGSSSSTSS